MFTELTPGVPLRLSVRALTAGTLMVVSVATAAPGRVALEVSGPPRWPAVVAHRGSSAQVPEHTLAAYEQALADGADGFEADVRMTRDGHLVCVHDRRVDRTSNGRGAVSALDLAQLSRLDFGSWHASSAGPQEDEPHERTGPHTVLTLARLLELVTSTERPVTLAVETKHPTRWAGRVEHQLAADLARFGLLRAPSGRVPRIRVMSFSAAALRRASAFMPAVALAHLAQRGPTRLASGISIWGPSIELVRRHPERVAWAQAQGRAVHVWTVDDPGDMRLCAQLGVDAVITNRPAVARTVFTTSSPDDGDPRPLSRIAHPAG